MYYPPDYINSNTGGSNILPLIIPSALINSGGITTNPYHYACVVTGQLQRLKWQVIIAILLIIVAATTGADLTITLPGRL